MGRPSSFSEAYKREAVAQAAASGNISQTARALGISNKSLHSWIKTYGEPKRLDAETASAQQLAARVRQLEKQVAEKEVRRSGRWWSPYRSARKPNAKSVKCV